MWSGGYGKRQWTTPTPHNDSDDLCRHSTLPNPWTGDILPAPNYDVRVRILLLQLAFLIKMAQVFSVGIVVPGYFRKKTAAGATWGLIFGVFNSSNREDSSCYMTREQRQSPTPYCRTATLTGNNRQH